MTFYSLKVNQHCEEIFLHPTEQSYTGGGPDSLLVELVI